MCHVWTKTKEKLDEIPHPYTNWKEMMPSGGGGGGGGGDGGGGGKLERTVGGGKED